jgi:serine/threonine protein kinase
MTDEIFEGRYFYNKYKVVKKIGEGSFGQIYSAVNVTNDEMIALKLERKDEKNDLLETESYILAYLKGKGIPYVKSYGYSGSWNVLVMELLGKSIEDYLVKCKGKFSVKTTVMIGYQMVERLEFIHNKHIIHRDIKPENFVFGRGQNENILYLLDFGLAKKYRSSKNLQQFPFRTGKKLTGTARYASINALSGCSQSRRDDLESVGYVLMYLLRGSLPWQGLKVYGKEDKYQKILQKKKETPVEELCKGFPEEFAMLINNVKKLSYTDDPDYGYLRSLLEKIMKDNSHEFDYLWDWTKVELKSEKTKPEKETEGNSNKAFKDVNEDKEGF